jgi:hypothetical protein
MDVLIRPMEFSEAVAKVKNRIPVGSKLDTEGWGRQELALRENAFFSAKVEEARVLSEMQRGVLGHATKSEFVAKTRRWLLDNGFERATNQQDLRQLTSTRRLELIFEHNTEAARGYGWWKQGQDPDVLDAFPCQEFIRIASRKMPRQDWERRWRSAGGKVYGGRMIAKKNDPVWTRLSRFGTPWPPFDFSSGMGVEDVSREEAEELGILQPDEPVGGDEKDFNNELSGSVRNLSDNILQKTIGALRNELGQDAVKVDGDRVWLKQDPGGRDVATRPMGIPPRARESLVHYTEDKDFVRHWNLRTRRGQPTAADRRRNEEVDLALAALPRHEGVVYRRMGKFSDSSASAYMVGDIKTWNALSSASKVPQSGFGDKVEFRIVSRRGRDVSGLSVKPEQQEVLFRTGSRFRVTGRHKEGEMWFIDLEELVP